VGHWASNNMGKPVRQLLYVSNTRRDLAQPDLESILVASRRNNAAAGITGMLLFMDGAFLQVLEGDSDAVAQTYARIRRDARHWHPQTLVDQDAPRAFGQWSMGFERLNPGAFGPDHLSKITQEAVAAKLTPDAPLEIAMLVRNFQRVHVGDTLSA